MYEEQKQAFEYINKTITKNKKISHAYLIETNNYDKYFKFIKEFIKILLSADCDDEEDQKRIKYEVENDIYPDIRYIYPDGNYIKKEQLLSLEADFSKSAINNNYLICVIDQADRLNDSSANTILKFLEEPEKGIIALLVTNNRYRVLETIISRCQILSLKATKTNIKYDDNLLSFLKQINNPKDLLCNFDNYYENLFNDRITGISSINTIEEIIFEYINGILDDTNTNDIFIDINEKKLLDILSLLALEKDRLNYNVNMKLWLTDFIIKLIEVK